MSLLQHGREVVKVFPEETVDDADGNDFTRAGSVGVVVRASLHPLGATESADGGFNTVSRYRLRLVNYPGALGAQAQIEWNGKRYSILGGAMIHNSSPRTRHVEYVMMRA